MVTPTTSQSIHRIATCLLVLCAFSPTQADGQVQADDDVAKSLGEIAAYARRCGDYDDAGWLQSTFGELAAFQKARKEKTVWLEGYDIVHIKCGVVRQAIESVRAQVDELQE